MAKSENLPSEAGVDSGSGLPDPDKPDSETPDAKIAGSGIDAEEEEEATKATAEALENTATSSASPTEDASATDDSASQEHVFFPEEVSRLSKFIRRFPYAVLVVLMLFQLFIAITNPFSMDEASDYTTSEEASLVMAPFYGGDRAAWEKIVVILIDQKFLDQHSESHWPPSYGSQAKLIRNLSRLNPDAVFLDFQYQRAHSLDAQGRPIRPGFEAFGLTPTIDPNLTDIADFVSALDAARASGPRIFMADVANTPGLAPLYNFSTQP